MNYKELKDEIKQEKKNYYDKNIMKRLFIKTPNLKKIIKTYFKKLNLYIIAKKYIKILLKILLNYMGNSEKT